MDDRIKNIADFYEFSNQADKFVEECSEAIQAVMKLKSAMNEAVKKDRVETDELAYSYTHLREEVADVLVTAEQMRYFLGEDLVNGFIERKIRRQIERMTKER